MQLTLAVVFLLPPDEVELLEMFDEANREEGISAEELTGKSPARCGRLNKQINGELRIGQLGSEPYK